MADADMDMDMDIDFGPGPDEEVVDVDTSAIDPQTLPDTTQGLDDDAMEGSLVPEKINLRGVDDMSTDDIHKFAYEHFPSQEPSQIQWVNDTSANIVYPSAETAREALMAFLEDDSITADSVHFIGEEGVNAKRLSTHPDTVLLIRLAQTTDVKKVGARDASRFYLMNPDKDPREQRERQRREAMRRKRRREDDEAMKPFDVNMYDDPPAASKLDLPLSDGPRPRRRMSADLLGDRPRVKRNRADTRRAGDLFDGRISTRSGSERLRDRSASPKDAYEAGDGRYGFAEDVAGVLERQRSLSPSTYHIRGSAKQRNVSKRDLLGDSRRGTSLFKSGQSELFPSLGSPARELLPGRKGSTSSQHRRTDALDADDDTIRSPIPNGKVVKTLADRVTLPGRSLEERISRPGASLADRIARSNDTGISGRSSRDGAQSNPGFQIRGVAGAMNPKVKELFPGGSGDGKTDLFSRIEGKATRQRAGDLFG